MLFRSYALGVAALDAGHLSRAIFAFERVLEVKPDHGQARAELARAYLAAGDVARGREELMRVRRGDLPPEAARTVDLIERGGPFPEPEHDGGVFGNREELLPDEDYGYYREYTVPTPGSPDRGARRIIAGDGGELYWTADHYASFARIVVGS